VVFCGIISILLFIGGLISDDGKWLIAAGLFAIASMI
jgi:hypothetical protein